MNRTEQFKAIADNLELLKQLPASELTSEDWLNLTHTIDPFHRPAGFVSQYCPNLGIFSQAQLLELFTCRAITAEDFDKLADRSRLAVKDWAEILWNNPTYIPSCPAEVWPQLTPEVWKSIPYIFKPYFVSAEQWKLIRTRQTQLPWAAFFDEQHPEWAGNFPCRGKNIIGKP